MDALFSLFLTFLLLEAALDLVGPPPAVPLPGVCAVRIWAKPGWKSQDLQVDEAKILCFRSFTTSSTRGCQLSCQLQLGASPPRKAEHTFQAGTSGTTELRTFFSSFSSSIHLLVVKPGKWGGGCVRTCSSPSGTCRLDKWEWPTREGRATHLQEIQQKSIPKKAPPWHLAQLLVSRCFIVVFFCLSGDFNEVWDRLTDRLQLSFEVLELQRQRRERWPEAVQSLR